jgi:hypothetical protein
MSEEEEVEESGVKGEDRGRIWVSLLDMVGIFEDSVTLAGRFVEG